MMSIAQIRALQADAAADAARRKVMPFLVEQEDVDNQATLPRIPFIGNYLPKGWRRVDPGVFGFNRSAAAAPTIEGVSTYFVDRSGMGTVSEPALTIEEFLHALQPGYGYAIVEIGQFQLAVGIFDKI